MKDIKKFQHLLLMLLLLLVIAACEEEPGPSREEIVTQEWNVDDVVENGSSQGSQNTSADFTLSRQYTLIIPGLEGLGNSGSWEFNSDQSAIILDDGSLEVIAEIVDISEDRLVLEFDFENYKGDITTYRITLTS